MGAAILHGIDGLTDTEEADVDAIYLDTEAAAMGQVVPVCHSLVGQSTTLIARRRCRAYRDQGLDLFFLLGREGRRTD